MKQAAFKEWHVVCEAIGRGLQDVIIRKGGIHEGRDGFQFEYDDFYLFPTLFHRQAELVKPVAHEWLENPSDKRLYEEGEMVEIRYRCRVSRVEVVRDWEMLRALDGRHVYTEELLRERFEWEGKGMAKGSVSVAYVTAEILSTPLTIEYKKSRHGGCRSWVEING